MHFCNSREYAIGYCSLTLDAIRVTIDAACIVSYIYGVLFAYIMFCIYDVCIISCTSTFQSSLPLEAVSYYETQGISVVFSIGYEQGKVPRAAHSRTRLRTHS